MARRDGWREKEVDKEEEAAPQHPREEEEETPLMEFKALSLPTGHTG